MAKQWKSYFGNVNGKLASIALDIGLREHAPDENKPWLLWVSVYMLSPRPDGLSHQSEFEMLCAIEDDLVKELDETFGATQCGRVTSDGHREFYFYGAQANFKLAVEKTMGRFSQYRFEFGTKDDAQWKIYADFLYPTEEQMECIKNGDVLGVLLDHCDILQASRDVLHWIYFRSGEDRVWFISEVEQRGYQINNKVDNTDDTKGAHPFGLTIMRNQSISPDKIDDTVLELFRLAKQVDAEYDGWESQIVTSPPN